MGESVDIDVLRGRNQRMTPQRLLTLEVVREQCAHISADEVHALVEARYPYISLATIYRTLQWLHEQGLVSQIDQGDGRTYYEYRSAPHHHLICNGCGAMSAIHDDVLHPLKARLLELHGFAATFDHLAIFGRCAGCQGAHNPPAPGP